VIVVDQITPELERTIEFLNQCGGGRFSFHALEMRRFQTMGTEILVPHLHGAAPVEPGGRSTPRHWILLIGANAQVRLSMAALRRLRLERLRLIGYSAARTRSLRATLTDEC
jgi:hypothetical protein